MTALLRFLLVAALAVSCSSAFALDVPANMEQCQALCNQYFGGGTTPVTPPVTPPPTTTTPFPHKITFERSADQNNQKAAVLFRTLQDAQITGVSVNGEVARRGNPYKNCPVFLLTKDGNEYLRPLKFVIKMSDGKTYTATSGSSSTGGGGTNPAGYSKQEAFTSYGERNGGRKAWRIPKKGPAFGAKIKVVFSDGHTVYVNDTSHNYRESDGFVFKPGLGPNGTGDANTGTSHGGVYLHAPYGNKSMKATFYYN